MVLLYIIHSLLSFKFRSTLAKIAKIYMNISFLNKYALFLFGTLFLPKKNPRRERRRASTRGWSYPITFRSLVVWSTARTQHFDNFLTFFWHLLKLFGIIRDASRGSLEVVRSNFYQTYVRYFFSKKCLGGFCKKLNVLFPDSRTLTRWARWWEYVSHAK